MENLALRTEFCGTLEQSSWRPLKPGLSRENWDKGGSCSSAAHVQNSCTGPPTHSSPAFYTVGVMFLCNGLERSISEANHISVSSSFIHLVICLTTSPKPLPKRALHIVRSWASSFKWQHPLLSLRSSSSFLRLLPCLPVTSIPPFYLSFNSPL